MTGKWSQEKIVFFIFVLTFVGLSIGLNGFLSVANALTLVRSVAVLGMLGVGMALVVIGRGIDLSVIANMVMSVGFTLYLANQGHAMPVALLFGLLISLAFGLINGILIAYAEIPALFATLAFGTCVYGFGRVFLIPTDVVYLPQNTGWFEFLGKGTLFEVPMPIVAFLLLSLLAFLLLRFTKFGRFVYGIGENYQCARITGIPVRVMVVVQYVITSAVTFVSGVVFATSVSSVNTRLFNSTMIYDVILVVVLGGIGLSGGKGGVRNVIVGSLLIGTMLNGMTIMDMPVTVQNLIKGMMLLIAITIDTMLNPRDEQVSQQGDI